MRIVKLAVIEVDDCTYCPFYTETMSLCDKIKNKIDIDYRIQNFPDECPLDEMEI